MEQSVQLVINMDCDRLRARYVGGTVVVGPMTDKGIYHRGIANAFESMDRTHATLNFTCYAWLESGEHAPRADAQWEDYPASVEQVVLNLVGARLSIDGDIHFQPNGSGLDVRLTRPPQSS